jgi:tRNA wybutosine-synthesizing protein 2
MAEIVKLHHGERIADMCAGIGYFAIPMAVAGAIVHAMEINPVAFGYLERNIRANRVRDRVTAECGDCRALLRGEYDRVILGHFSSSTMIASALLHVHRGSVLHVHSAGPVPPDQKETIASAGLSADVTTRVVKKFSPGKWHFVQDIVIR